MNPSDALRVFLDERLGDRAALTVEPMVGGGSCDVYAVTRDGRRWVLRRAPSHASSATAHDVLREFRILDAIKDEPVPIARPLLGCDDPAVFGAPFYLMDRIDGVPVRSGIPEAWTARPEEQARALEQLVDALVAIHAVDWDGCGLADLAHAGPYLERQIGRWMSQLASYGGRPLPLADRVAGWLGDDLPPDQPPALAHGDYKLDNVLFAETAPPDLLAVVDWEMASIGDPLVDLAWAMIFHPGPEGTMPLGVGGRLRVRPVARPDAHVAGRALLRAFGARRRGHRLVRRVLALEARHRPRGQLRQVPARRIEETDPRALRPPGRPAARERGRHRRAARLMPKPGDFELDADEIVAAAIVILRERGLDAVSMRNVADRLGVSPMPLYTRVGNKAALIDAVADHLLTDLAPAAAADEAWPEYAERWCRELRHRLKLTPDSRLYLGAARDAYVEASRPLIAAMREGGLSADASVQACRVLMWATVGFVAMEQGSGVHDTEARRGRLSGSNPAGVTAEEADELFDLHVGLVTSGLARMHGDEPRDD